MRHAQPRLEHAEHTTRSGSLIVVTNYFKATARFPRIVIVDVAREDRVVDTPEPVAILLPSLDAAAVAVRPERKPVVAWVADAQPVAVGDGVGGGEGRGGGDGVPEGHQEGLRGKEVRVRARFDLRGRPVKLVDLGVI